jgi:HD-GYP domain-containing protein (c-di-GMP phosphodiesterase class II)
MDRYAEMPLSWRAAEADADQTSALVAAAAAVPPVTSSAVIEGAIETAREFLGMDMAYVAETRHGLQAYYAVGGDAASFGVSAGESVPLEGTYCAAMLDGELDNAVPDSAADARVRDLPITRDGQIGAYVGVPIPLADGTVYGTFCCLSHSAEPSLGDRELDLMRVLARLIGLQLDREAAAAETQRLAVAAGNVAALVAALQARDGYTEEHSRAVVDLSVAVGREIGLAAGELAELETVALLHDIGKIGVADAVLRKPGRLTAEEEAEMRRHPEIGARIVGSMPGLAALAPAIRAEHERWDGGGYPDGLRGDQIPLASRIVLVCDAYHAMTSDRPYRRSLRAEDARAELRRNAGTQFCPTTIEAALAVLAPDEVAADAALHGRPDIAALVRIARGHDELADELDIRAGVHARHGKSASAAIARRQATEHRERARRALARAQETE